MTLSRPKTAAAAVVAAPATATAGHADASTAADAARAPRAAAPARDRGGERAFHLLRRAWRWWLPPATLALLLAILFRDPFAGDWDALDYTVNAVRGQPSSMLFGRMLFIFTNHAAYRVARGLFGLQTEHAYLLFKYMVIAQTPFAVAACWTLARELTGSLRAATVAAFMLALSPFFIVYSGQAMTETPSLLLVSAALAMHLRGVRARKIWQVMLGAALLGLCVNVREPVGFFGLWLVLAPTCYGWKLKRRELLLTAASSAIFLVCALAPFAVWWLADVGGYRQAWYGWVASMRAESALHPVRLRNLVPFSQLFLIAAPVTVVLLPFALRREWRARGWTPLLAMALVGLFCNLVLLANYSTVINARYQLTGLPGLVPLCAAYLVERWTTRGRSRRGFVYACATVIAVSVLIGSLVYGFTRQTIANHGMTKEYRARLARLPPDAVVMAGGQTVSVNYYRGLGFGRWDVIGTGGGWPGARLTHQIEWHLQQGHRVFVDVDPRLWSMDTWHEAETRALADLPARFGFRHHAATFYELRPPGDETADDDPNLCILLNKPRSRFK
ncbi:MAG: glycosyltransferase family 39 protein [Acidobacteria bacterium]|nr:glycosyltransferase family 39 protein [Acidobacteriota bacterium]